MAPRDPTIVLEHQHSDISTRLIDEVLSAASSDVTDETPPPSVEKEEQLRLVQQQTNDQDFVIQTHSSKDDDNTASSSSTTIVPSGQSNVDLVAWGWECVRGTLFVLPIIIAMEYQGAFRPPYFWISCYVVGLFMHEVSFMTFILAQYLWPILMAGYLLYHGQYPTWTMLLWFLPVNYFYVGVPMSVILHRYFAHSSYDTSRTFQFILGCIGCLAYQGGPLFWAAKHGKHHCHCDQPLDPHSAKQTGVLYAWILWSMDPKNHVNTDYEYLNPKLLVPEIQFIDRFYLIPPVLLLTVAELYLGRLTTVVLVYLPMMTCRMATSWFNVDFHPVVDEKTGAPIAKRCTAIDKFILSHEFVGESLHEDHHRVPNRARRRDLDLAWWVSLSWMEQIGLVWNCK